MTNRRFNLNKFRIFGEYTFKRLIVKSLAGQSGLPDEEATDIQAKGPRRVMSSLANTPMFEQDNPVKRVVTLCSPW